MKWHWSVFLLALLSSPALAQFPSPAEMLKPAPPVALPPAPAGPASAPTFDVTRGEPTCAIPALACYAPGPDDTGTAASNRKFPNFIGWGSNPLQNIDPRSLTQIVPIFASAWVSPSVLPEGDLQVYGPAISIAVNDRLCIGLNQGGFVAAAFERGDIRRPLLNRLARNRGAEYGGNREGFLNIGGFVQYTLVEDVEDQFLLTAGLRVVTPSGSTEVFQGRGPALLAPYVTAGKEFGDFHLLGTFGYQFPAGSAARGTDVFYLNAHLDRQFFGWLYPMVEANWSQHTTSVDIDQPTRDGFLNFGNFESSGNIVTVAAGVNCVLIRDRLEIGAVYVTDVASERNFDVDAVIFKMVLRY